MDNFVPLAVLVCLVIGGILMAINKIFASSAKKDLRQQGFQVDKFFEGQYGQYVALDLNKCKIALKGAQGGPEIHGIDQIQSASRPDPTDSFVVIVVMPRMGTLREYRINLNDTNEPRYCLDALRGLGIQPPDDLDILYM